MKKLALAAFALTFAACASPTAPHRPTPSASAAHDLGDPCIDEFGRSGYMVTAGRGELVCQAY